MQELINYIKDILGLTLLLEPIPEDRRAHLPLYIREAYRLYYGHIYNNLFVLAELKNENEFGVSQIEKHLEMIHESTNEKVALVVNTMSALNRRRLIEKKIAFIVPGKQMFLPDILLDLRENFIENKNRRKIEKLLPSAQYILLYHIQHRYDKVQLTELSFKDLAKKFDYTQMAITLAVENLKHYDLCEVRGAKEKYIKFEQERNELWHIATPFLVSPVLKRVYVDEKPDIFMFQSNVSALPEYSDLNPGRQKYYAIEKSRYYKLKKDGTLINENEYEGNICLEVWKYNPSKLAEGITEEDNVDPLSLYLSLKENPDERIEMALDQIIDKNIW